MKRSIVALAVLAVAFSALYVGRLLASYDFDPSTTIKFGEVFEEHNKYGADLLGDIVLAPKAGHDGKFFFTQAMDPFYLEPQVHAIYLDRPTYRAQRMAYPTIASLGGLLPAQATAWGLIIVNIVAMAVGTVYTGLVAMRMGLSSWFGLAFFINPGMIVDLSIDGAGVVAMAGMMAGVYYFVAGDLLPAAISLSLAALSRETMLIAAIGLAAFYWHKNRRPVWILTLPVIAVALWWVYLHWRLEDGLAQDTQALDLPFVGFGKAFVGWLNTPGSTIDLAVGSILLIIAVVTLIRSTRTPTALGWAASGFALLGVFMSEPVWERWFDSTRALAPVLTTYILLVSSLSRVADPSFDEQTSPADITLR